MQITFVTSGTINSFWNEKLSLAEKADLLVFGFNGLGLVNYKKELDGETEYFQDLAKLSKQISSVVVCGCDTDTFGVFRHSVVVADNGKILGVSDMVHTISDGEFVSGSGFRVYDTTAGKIGIVVSEDVFFPEVPRVLALCDADIIICVMNKIDNLMPQIMLRAGAYANGVAMCLCAKGYTTIADIKGNIALSSSAEIIKSKIKIEKDYKLISSRRRGLYKDFNSGY